MRVIFMGTPDFAVGTLEEIIKAGHEVVLVVSQPDKAVGRSKALRYTPVKACALEHGIEVYQPQKVRDSECIERLRTYHPDIIIVEAFGQIIPRAILDMPRYGCVNVHASLLPKYRGAAPIQWAVINGDAVTGVTTMRMDEGLDTGDMIEHVVVPIDAKETGESLHDKLAVAVCSTGRPRSARSCACARWRRSMRERQPTRRRTTPRQRIPPRFTKKWEALTGNRAQKRLSA